LRRRTFIANFKGVATLESIKQERKFGETHGFQPSAESPVENSSRQRKFC
jgi:hypothetical protein